MPHDQLRPGDVILNRYMPDAPADVREQARRRLYEFVRVQFEIACRLERERISQEPARSSDSHDLGGRLILEHTSRTYE